MCKLHTIVSAFPIFTKVLGQERLIEKAALAIAMAAMRRSTRGETDAERMAGTFGSKTGLTRTDFTPGDRGSAEHNVFIDTCSMPGLVPILRYLT